MLMRKNTPRSSSFTPLVMAVLLTAMGGCQTVEEWAAGGWVFDYSRAERRSESESRAIIFYYKDTRPNSDKSAHGVLESKQVRAAVNNFVRCILYNNDEADRRYIGQFGVDRAPAVVILHTDGTYHTYTGSFEETALAAFITNAQPPGAKPMTNRFIRREAYYDWYGSLEAAETVSKTTHTPILVVLAQTPVWETGRLYDLLSVHEVYLRCSQWVHCKQEAVYPFTPSAAGRFGVTRFPALGVILPSGATCSLERPAGAEEIARFLQSCLQLSGSNDESHPAPDAQEEGNENPAQTEQE